MRKLKLIIYVPKQLLILFSTQNTSVLCTPPSDNIPTHLAVISYNINVQSAET